jgi:hypothetical protein
MTDHFWMRRQELLGTRKRKVYFRSRLARDLDAAANAAHVRSKRLAAAMRRLASALDRMAV